MSTKLMSQDVREEYLLRSAAVLTEATILLGQMRDQIEEVSPDGSDLDAMSSILVTALLNDHAIHSAQIDEVSKVSLEVGMILGQHMVRKDSQQLDVMMSHVKKLPAKVSEFQEILMDIHEDMTEVDVRRLWQTDPRFRAISARLDQETRRRHGK